MKPFLIVGNWKSNKTVGEAQAWIQEFSQKIQKPSLVSSDITIVIAAPFTALAVLKYMVTTAKLPLALGAQNVSQFPEGAYTGEVTAKMIKEQADWVIIGHSERRKNFGETDEILAQKCMQAKAAGLKIIYCVPDYQTVIPQAVDVVAYEPVWAIGTGKADTPEKAGLVVATIKEKTKSQIVIYGGSVTAENVASFVREPAIDGVLPGGASLSATKFWELIVAA